MLGFLGDLVLGDELFHIGTKRHSGRYPWGSGNTPFQHESWFSWGKKEHHQSKVNGAWFHNYVNWMKDEGYTENEIATINDIPLRKLRARVTVSIAQERNEKRAHAMKLLDHGYSKSEAARLMDMTPSSFQSLVDETLNARNNLIFDIADTLEKQLETKRFLDVGKGTDTFFNVSDTKIEAALAALEEKGYHVYNVKIPVPNKPGKNTPYRVLAPKDATWADVNKNPGDIHPVMSYTEDRGRTIRNIIEPVSIDSSRVMVNYAETGGTEKDGVIELRRGVKDLNLGSANYAQVRIMVDGTHYLKGMAVYSDDLPEGVDIRFNTKKTSDTPMLGEGDKTVLKHIKSDPDNPFGASIKAEDQLIRCQTHYTDDDGNIKLSPLNIVNEEGNWGNWSKTLASQFLAKQYPVTAKTQLKLTLDIRKAEYEDLKMIKDPSIRRYLMEQYALELDSDQYTLHAAAMPRQKSHVILPLGECKETEIYAPGYEDGEQVMLVRYPHAGIFESPVLTVNNRMKEGNKTIGPLASDAVGINYKTAQQLSGADFDGDTVLVIPTKGWSPSYAKRLPELENFDTDFYKKSDDQPKTGYKTDGFKEQFEMGSVSNLIMDMTVQKADLSEIARAVKHSMVIIDAEKHNLDWRASYEENGIAQLKTKYQGGAKRGAATLITKAGSTVQVDELSEYGTIDSEGNYVRRKTGRTYNTYDRETHEIVKENVKAKSKVSKILYRPDGTPVEDANELSTGSKMESIYADYINELKSLAKEVRKEAYYTETYAKDPEASRKYAKEVESIMDKVNAVKLNAPLDRRAKAIAEEAIRAKIKDNPELRLKENSDQLKKIKDQCLAGARRQVGSKRPQVELDEAEKEAIESHAISNTVMKYIMQNMDSTKLKEWAMPKESRGMSDAKVSLAKSMASRGCTIEEIAEQLNVSTTTISKVLNS